MGEKMKIKDTQHMKNPSTDNEDKKLAWIKPDISVLKYEDTSNNPGGGDFNGRAS
jgi:hypothetical protein